MAYDELTADELAARLPRLRFPAGFVGILEHAPAGYINPRGLIAAQLAIFATQGGTILRETAVTVTLQSTHLTVQTKEGNRYETRKLLIAAGGFSNCFGLLERPLPLRLKTETIILTQTQTGEAARLGDMPTVIYGIESSDLDGIYLSPADCVPGRPFLPQNGLRHPARPNPAARCGRHPPLVHPRRQRRHPARHARRAGRHHSGAAGKLVDHQTMPDHLHAARQAARRRGGAGAGVRVHGRQRLLR